VACNQQLRLTRSRGISALHEPSHQEKAAALDAEKLQALILSFFSMGHGCYRDAMLTHTANLLHITVYQNIGVIEFLTSNGLTCSANAWFPSTYFLVKQHETMIRGNIERVLHFGIWRPWKHQHHPCVVSTQ
jgi:hypothetical protein